MSARYPQFKFNSHGDTCYTIYAYEHTCLGVHTTITTVSFLLQFSNSFDWKCIINWNPIWEKEKRFLISSSSAYRQHERINEWMKDEMNEWITDCNNNNQMNEMNKRIVNVYKYILFISLFRILNSMRYTKYTNEHLKF